MAGEKETITSVQVLEAATALAKRLCDDPIVSDDIKELAAIVRLLADGQVGTDEAIQTLAKRPAGINVTYGK
jgi:hypothetical protein